LADTFSPSSEEWLLGNSGERCRPLGSLVDLFSRMAAPILKIWGEALGVGGSDCSYEGSGSPRGPTRGKKVGKFAK